MGRAIGDHGWLTHPASSNKTLLHGSDDRRFATAAPPDPARHQASVRQRNRLGLLAGPGFFPFVEAIDRHEAAAALECVAEGRPGRDPFRLGVD